jgi:hypothetical protein
MSDQAMRLHRNATRRRRDAAILPERTRGGQHAELRIFTGGGGRGSGTRRTLNIVTDSWSSDRDLPTGLFFLAAKKRRTRKSTAREERKDAGGCEERIRFLAQDEGMIFFAPFAPFRG